MLTIWIIVLFMEDDRLISLASTFFVILLGYFGLTQVNVFSKKSALPAEEEISVEAQALPAEEGLQAKYQNSTLSEKELVQIHEPVSYTHLDVYKRQG